MMFDLGLFLGVPADSELQNVFSNANPHMVSFFMNGGDYLTKISQNDQNYIGKPLPLSCTVSHLQSVEIHLLSLLRKLAPDYPFSPLLITSIHDYSRNR